jgi:hypothetical protein
MAKVKPGQMNYGSSVPKWAKVVKASGAKVD